nr:protein FAM71B-like [Pogona vitticeps]XP_020641288.1 protein FAM71B-like [Pogona vitticeps]XP_020641289.1 protein FAM71B-like [Pogona vitticeps]
MLRSQPPNISTRGNYGKGLFDQEMGPLQRQLSHGEYNLLRFAPMLESEFLQINKRGEVIDVHNQVETVTVAMACTSPNLQLPNVLLLARPIFPAVPILKYKHLRSRPTKKLELTRLLPLHFVKISVHNHEKKQLRFKLASGRTFYLQLSPQPGLQEDTFGLWVKVINMLGPPSVSTSELQSNVEEPAVPAELPPQKPQSPSVSLDLVETVSIRSLYSPPELASPEQEDARSRQSMVLSVGSLQGPGFLSRPPVTSEERIPDSDTYTLAEGFAAGETFEKSVSPRSHGRETDTSESSPPPRREATKSRSASRSGRRKSSPRGTSRKPSKIISLIRACSWGGRQRSKSQESKTKGKGKKR